MKKPILPYFALFVCLLAPPAGAGGPIDYAWPSDASRMLTSTFGEYRSHRFHAGMDVKTFGQVGYKALAVRPGSVSRVEVSPWGYGRVLYLLLDTGETAVYGHLQKFAPEVARRVGEEQQRTGRYAVALRFAEGEIPVEQGEVIGWTGQSGSGAPHLHFELRDASESPLNPLLKGYKVKDSIAPSIRRVMLIPLNASARVAGDLEPLTLTPKTAQGGRLQIDRTIPVFGRVGFAVSMLDQIDGAANRMNVHSYRLLIDGEERFSARCDRYPYELDHQADLDRDYRALMRTGDLYQRLFREAGNELPFYAGDKPWYGTLECDPASGATTWLTGITRALGFFWDLPSGVTILEKGLHTFRIEARDFNGNLGVVEGRLQAGPPQQNHAEAAGAEPVQASYTINAGYYDNYARVAVSASQALRRPPRLTARYRSGHEEEIPLTRSSKSTFLGGVPLLPGLPGPVRLRITGPEGEEPLHEVMLDFITVRKGREKKVTTQDGLCEITFDSESLFKPVFVRARTRNRGAEKLPLVSRVYEIEPADLPLSSFVTVLIRTEPGLSRPDQVALYRRAQRDQWRYIGRESGSHGAIGSRSRELGEFALIRDSEPPLIKAISPAAGARLSARTPLLQVSVRDALSGIGDNEPYALILDGKRLITEYDPERDRLIHLIESPLAAGSHILEITAADRCGNEARASWKFTVN